WATSPWRAFSSGQPSFQTPRQSLQGWLAQAAPLAPVPGRHCCQQERRPSPLGVSDTPGQVAKPLNGLHECSAAPCPPSPAGTRLLPRLLEASVSVPYVHPSFSHCITHQRSFVIGYHVKQPKVTINNIIGNFILWVENARNTFVMRVFAIVGVRVDLSQEGIAPVIHPICAVYAMGRLAPALFFGGKYCAPRLGRDVFCSRILASASNMR